MGDSNETYDNLRLHSITEAARILRIRKATVYEWINAGELAYKVVGKRKKIPHLALRDFIENTTEKNIPISEPNFNFQSNTSGSLDNIINSLIRGI